MNIETEFNPYLEDSHTELSREHAHPPDRYPEHKARQILRRAIDIPELAKKLHEPLNNESFLNDMARLVLELRDKLPEYNTVLGDDGSGRLPTLILGQLVNEQSAHYHHPANIRFIASGHNSEVVNEHARSDYLKEYGPKFGKTLVVTEYIYGGNSMEELAEMLKGAGVDYDIAAVTIRNPRNHTTGR